MKLIVLVQNFIIYSEYAGNSVHDTNYEPSENGESHFDFSDSEHNLNIQPSSSALSNIESRLFNEDSHCNGKKNSEISSTTQTQLSVSLTDSGCNDVESYEISRKKRRKKSKLLFVLS